MDDSELEARHIPAAGGYPGTRPGRMPVPGYPGTQWEPGRGRPRRCGPARRAGWLSSWRLRQT
eukprot:3315595-Rhodomonas_salina.1